MGCQVLTFKVAIGLDWIGLDWIRVDQIGLADTFKQDRDLNSSTKPEHEEGDKSPVQGVEALLGPGRVEC